MSLLIFDYFTLKRLLDQDLITKHIDNVLLPLYVVVEVVLRFAGKNCCWQIVRLQGVDQVRNLNIVILSVTDCSKVDNL